jgi:hypothetical protein
MKTKKEYIAPSLKEYSVETELGFATSLVLHNLWDDQPLDEYNDQGQENWFQDNTFSDRW